MVYVIVAVICGCEFLGNISKSLISILLIACLSCATWHDVSAIIDKYNSQHEEQAGQMEHIDDETSERIVIAEDADGNRYEVLESDLNPVD